MTVDDWGSPSPTAGRRSVVAPVAVVLALVLAATAGSGVAGAGAGPPAGVADGPGTDRATADHSTTDGSVVDGPPLDGPRTDGTAPEGSTVGAADGPPDLIVAAGDRDGDGRTGTAEDGDGDDEYGTLSAALSVSTPGDRVGVAPGTYAGPVAIRTANVTLSGLAGRPTVSGAGGAGTDRPLVGVGAPNVTVAGLRLADAPATALGANATVTVRNVTVEAPAGRGIRARGAASVTVVDVLVREPGDAGVFVAGAATARLRNVTVRSAGGAGVDVGATDATIRATTVAGATDVGVNVLGGDRVRLRNVTVRGVAGAPDLAGVTVLGGDRVRLRTVRVRNSTAGVAVSDAGRARLQNVTALDNRGPGLSVADVAPLRVVGGRYANDTVGVELLRAGNATVRGVRAVGNDVGLRLRDRRDLVADRVRLCRSTFERNRIGLEVADDGVDVAGVEVRYVAFRGNREYGVRSANRTGVLDATSNYWGAPGGPSTERGDDDGPFRDPRTGAPADGRGDAVSEGAVRGRSNVAFDPFLRRPPARVLHGVGRFDRNGDGRIDDFEVLIAVAAFNAGGAVGGERVDVADLLDVIAVYTAGGRF